MSWHFLERWVEKANQHSTLIGKFWITFLIICRMVIVATVGDRVYNDEQSEFKCNTLQPGCTNVCFNSFSPISHLRFWSFQILFVAAPSVMFVIYSAHTTKMKKAELRKARQSSEDDESEKPTSRKCSAPGGKGASGGRKHPRRSTQELITDDMMKRRASDGKTPPYPQQCEKTTRKWFEFSQRFPQSTLIRLKSSLNDFNSEEAEHMEEVNRIIGFDGEMGLANQRSVPVNCITNKRDADILNTNDNNNNPSNQTQQLAWKIPDPERLPKVEGFARPYASQSANFMPWLPHTEDQHFFRNYASRKNSQVEADMFPHNGFDHSEPPRYPGDTENAPGNPCKNERQGFASNATNPNLNHTRKRVRPRKKLLKKEQNRFPILLTDNFRWYVANVFVRLCLEAGFAFLQLLLFGWSVPELYKCERWPCPNVVDCFISRPTEKTIFLWFMFIYNCICVLLNVIELLYLIYAYSSEQLHKRLQRRRKLQEEKEFDYIKDSRINEANSPHHLKRNFHLPADDVSSWSSKHQMNMKNWPFYNDRRRKELTRSSKREGGGRRNNDLIAVILDSEEEREDNVDMDIARLEEDDINEADDYNAINADFVDMNQTENNEDQGMV